MSFGRRKRAILVGLGVVIVLATAAWVAGGQVRSPAQVAAETAAPDPSAITVPVEKRVLSSEVIVRGTVRYGSPQPVVLATSDVKAGASSGVNIVTTRPRRGARVGEGTVAMSVSGRPVFVLRGAQPSHRDIAQGSRGPDVRQLESALARMGFSPGRVDGRYTGETAAAVATWYESEGWAPFGSTSAQLDQLRAAKSAAAAARDAYLQSRLAIHQTRNPGTPGDIAQARIDLETARDTVDTAEHALDGQARTVSLAIANEKRDNALAAADVALKRSALNKALDAQVEAQRAIREAPPDTTASERVALQAALRATGDDVAVAQADVKAANASATATRTAGQDAVVKAQADRVRAQKALPTARRQVVLADRRLQVLQTPGDTTLQKLVSESAGREARGTAREVSRLARRMGIQVPADEVLFFSTLPLRVDSVRVRRGESVTGRVMTVSNSRLAVDSSLSVNDAKLVKSGAEVRIEEPDLGIRTTGVVTQVADRPGTHKVDPSRVYLAITPTSAPAQLVGASVKLTIAVKSTQEAVLTVPITALSVGADGSSRLQVQSGGRARYVTVQPGLAAQGLVEVRPIDGKLGAGDLVVVGEKGTALSDTGEGTTSPGTSSTQPGGDKGGATTSDSAGATSSDGASSEGKKEAPGRKPPAGTTP